MLKTFALVTAIGNWSMTRVTDADSMFENATSFNQPLASWDVSSVTDMASMFRFATNFNQDISSWMRHTVDFFHVGLVAG